MLVERTLFGTVDKIYDAISLLRENEPADGYYVCFSGGKDSNSKFHTVNFTMKDVKESAVFFVPTLAMLNFRMM